MDPLTTEFRLAAACVKWPVTAQTRQAIHQAADHPIDWTQFLGVVQRHRIGGLVHRALKGAGVPLPADISHALADRASAIARNAMMLTHETAQLQRLFEGAGIPVAVVKGAILAKLIYGDITVRHARDIDLLVSPDSVERASLLLEQSGYRRVYPPPDFNAAQLRAVHRTGKEYEFRHASGIIVELHWRLTANPALLSGMGVDRASQQVVLAQGVAVQTFSRDDLFSYLCVHGAAHSWFRIKWLADIGVLLDGENDAGRERLYRQAQKNGAGRAAAQAINLCAELLDTSMPAALLAEIRRSPVVRRLSAHAKTQIAGSESQEPNFGTTRRALAQFFIGHGWRYHWNGLRQALTSTDDMRAVALPARLAFLYPLLRLPLWLHRHLPVARWGRAGLRWAGSAQYRGAVALRLSRPDRLFQLNGDVRRQRLWPRIEVVI